MITLIRDLKRLYLEQRILTSGHDETHPEDSKVLEESVSEEQTSEEADSKR